MLPQDWFANYVATYVERDVRQLLQIKDLQLFQRFLRLAAARSGQLLNLSALGAGRMCWLLGIHSAEVLAVHPLRGQVFETMMVVDAYKSALNKGQAPALYFWRDTAGFEVDLLAQRAGSFECYEIKSGSTFSSDWFKQLGKLGKLNPAVAKSTVVYGGAESSSRSQGEVWGWGKALGEL